jgi:hypothetical protein
MTVHESMLASAGITYDVEHGELVDGSGGRVRLREMPTIGESVESIDRLGSRFRSLVAPEIPRRAIATGIPLNPTGRL